MKPGVIAQLRDFVPIRPLTRSEAFRIAELQATRLLSLSGIVDGPVPDRIVTDLPRVQVERVGPLPVSGAAEWSKGRWLVLLNRAEPIVRQRFSLMHETKHILDNRFIHVLYQAVPERDRAEFVENVCDYFAGCVLMPRPWLKRAWGEGVQHPADLAARFGVSQAAVNVRLAQVGLGERPKRCSQLSRRWALPARSGPGTREPYHRSAVLQAT